MESWLEVKVIQTWSLKIFAWHLVLKQWPIECPLLLFCMLKSSSKASCRFLDEQMRRSFTNSNYTESYYCSFPFFKYTLKNIKHKITFKPMWKCFCWRSVECNNTITMGHRITSTENYHSSYQPLPFLVALWEAEVATRKGHGWYSEWQFSLK